MRRLGVMLVMSLSCSGAPVEIPEPSELASAVRSCDLETLRQESARARIDLALHANEPEKAQGARWRLRLVRKSIEWCGSKT